jgi:hypothetical protein
VKTPRFRHAAQGFEILVFVRKIPDPPWADRLEIRAERWDQGAKEASWVRAVQIRKLDDHRIHEPVFTHDTVTLHAESSASTGHGEYDDQVLTIRLSDGTIVAPGG